ncbi:MAG TPA: DUF3999 family protein [Edaphobacter sp.]|nr:DUF3999 family protein [Edaphobacter sp.]
MKSILLALLLWQAASPGLSTAVADPQFFRYQRTITLSPGAGQACIAIAPQIFPNASPSLKDIRLYQQRREIPYAITLSEPSQPDSEPARVLNLGLRGRTIVFDLAMPARPYTEVQLDLAGKDYLATAAVSGKHDPNAASSTSLGEFTLFDLSSQHLSSNTTLPLQESSFPFLHIELTVSSTSGYPAFVATPQMVLGADVPPSREAQTLYTRAFETNVVTQRGHKTIATFALPERVPIERISFAIAPEFKSNFSRDVRVSDRPAGTAPAAGENIAGTILRVKLTQAGREIHEQQLSIPATIGSNLQSAATVEVAVENGNDAPLPITAVRLEMRERKLCFDAPTSEPLTLYYGDPDLTAPQYDYARLFSAAGSVRTAALGSEQRNPVYKPRPDTRPITERHPELLWIVLLAVICSLGVVAVHSSKRLPR